MSLGVLEAGIDLGALDGVAGRAASDEVVGVFLPFAGARDDEIDAHDQGVLEAGAAVQTAITADVVVSLENLVPNVKMIPG